MLDLHDINGRVPPDTVRSYVLPDMHNQSICPIDRRPCTHGQLRRMDGLSLRISSGIQVKCGCHDIGCAWRGSIADCSAHLHNCTVRSSRNQQHNNNNLTMEEESNLSERIIHHEDASEALRQLEILRQTVNCSIIKHEMSDCKYVGI